MKIKVWIETEVEADVSLGDMLAELSALPDSERQPSILSAINSAHGILKRVAVEHIAEMDDKQRGIISNALREQADRYLTAS